VQTRRLFHIARRAGAGRERAWGILLGGDFSLRWRRWNCRMAGLQDYRKEGSKGGTINPAIPSSNPFLQFCNSAILQFTGQP
jgi:hypothetical protein